MRTFFFSILVYLACSSSPLLSLVLLLPAFPGGSDVCWVREDVLATAMDSGDVVLWKHGSLGHSLQRLTTLGCHDSMVLGLDGPQGSTLLTHGGDGGVTLINVGEEKVASQYRGVLLTYYVCRFNNVSWRSVHVSCSQEHLLQYGHGLAMDLLPFSV